MSMIPAASNVTMNSASASSTTPSVVHTTQEIVESMKSIDMLDMVKILKAAIAELEKKLKAQKAQKPVKEKKQKKAGSMPKGVVPKQLRKPRGWVEFVLKHANENGWEPFIISQTKKNKVTGEKETEEIEMSGSVYHEGLYVFEDSVTDACPTGKKAIHKDAMSLSKQYWTPKDQSGTRQDLYELFEMQYVDEDDVPVSEEEVQEEESTVEDGQDEEEVKEEPVKEEPVKEEPVKVKKISEKEQKALDAAEKKAKKEREVAEKKAKTPVKSSKIAEDAAIESKESVETEEVVKTPIKAKPSKEEPNAPIKAKKVVKKAVVEWTCPDDGNVHPWDYEGVTYLRTFDGNVWKASQTGELGDWVGQYDVKTGGIDGTAVEPEMLD